MRRQRYETCARSRSGTCPYHMRPRKPRAPVHQHRQFRHRVDRANDRWLMRTGAATMLVDSSKGGGAYRTEGEGAGIVGAAEAGERGEGGAASSDVSADAGGGGGP